VLAELLDLTSFYRDRAMATENLKLSEQTKHEQLNSDNGQ
jgi:hypothetical protein